MKSFYHNAKKHKIMLTLLSECHLWTARDEIRIKNTDFGAFKYSTKRDFDNKCVPAVGKKDYSERRNGIVLLSNRKPSRLKESVKKLEDLLKLHKIIRTEWKDSFLAQILLSNGILVHIYINSFTGDVQKIAFDKYFVGKLAADVISDAVFTRQHIIIAYNTNQVTVVCLQKPNMKKYSPEKIANMDPKIFHALIPGPSERKLPRHLVVNNSFDLLIVWTKSSQNEVYPWRPTLRDQDRANIHVYKLRSAKLELVAYSWTENDPICVEFLRASECQMLTVEQKVSRKGEITAEICNYEIGNVKLQRLTVTSIPIGTQICCHGFSPDQEKLILGTIDRYVCLHDLPRKITKFAPKTDIIPTQCAWHPDSGIIMISNDRAQFQCFDISLSFVANQLISEDVTPSNLLDLSHYFSLQPSLLNISYSKKPDLNSSVGGYAQTECFLLLIFENGPLGCLRFFSGSGMSGDVHNSGLSADVLINKYLSINQLEKAVNLLLTLNWETCGAMCLISLYKIANYVFTRSDVKRNRNELLIKALQSFADDLSDETKDEFGDQVVDIKRRFCFYLLRYKLFSEAYEVAHSIGDYDIFMDIFNLTKSNPKWYNIARESYNEADVLVTQIAETTTTVTENSATGDSISTCSHSSCSECVSQLVNHHSIGHKNNAETNRIEISAINSPSQYLMIKRLQKNHIDNGAGASTGAGGAGGKLKNYVPPLPYFKSTIFNAENIKINIPKPELKAENLLNSGAFRTVKRRNPHLSSEFRNRLDMPIYVDNNRSLSGHFVNNSRISYHSNSMVVPPLHHTSNAGFHVTSVIPPIASVPNNVQIIEPQQQQPQQHQQQQQIGSWSQVPDQTLGIPVASTIHVKNSSSTLSTITAATTTAASTTSSLNPLPQPRSFPSSVAGYPYSLSFNNKKLSMHENSPNNNLKNLSGSDHHLYTVPKFYQHPLVSGTIPSTNIPLVVDETQPLQQQQLQQQRLKKPAASILSNSSSQTYSGQIGSSSGTTGISSQGKKDSGEKNKVKFSDTVQVAVVPEIPRKEKPLPTKRNGFRHFLTDPRKELADSLPLCHPNDDYLKDFNPISEASTPTTVTKEEESTDSTTSKNSPTIKVVHFGVV